MDYKGTGVIAFLVGLIFIAPTVVLCQSQDDQADYISIDCGLPEGNDYTDKDTKLRYISDAKVIDTGVSKIVANEFRTTLLYQQFLYVRSFPNDTRNCYTLKLSQSKLGNKFLIRTRFNYGNYDSINSLPKFDLYLGIDYWDTIKIVNTSNVVSKEVIHKLESEFLHICLVNTNLGTPFISAIEIRSLTSNPLLYKSSNYTLSFTVRADLTSSSASREWVRYKDDAFDRMWFAFTMDNTTTLNTSVPIKSNVFQLPSVIMSTAATPQNPNNSLVIEWAPLNETDRFYVIVHFAELQILQPNQYRELSIFINGEPFMDNAYSPEYLQPRTFFGLLPKTYSSYALSINKTNNSTLPPIANAIEIYTIREFFGIQTNENDVNGIIKIKETYGVVRNWQGDPCGPKVYTWEGVECIYQVFNIPRITTLNLSSSGATGIINASMFMNLMVLRSLDLSNNNLSGKVPDLSQLTSLKVLNLKGNNFTGSIPEGLLKRVEEKSLSLSIDHIDDGEIVGSQLGPDNKKTIKFLIPAVVGACVMFVLIILATIFVILKRRNKVLRIVETKPNKQDHDPVLLPPEFKSENRQFTYAEVLDITNNREKVLGGGGFGKVYNGYVENTQVAVKILSESSRQGYKEFQAEVKILMNVHHKNLTSLVGYCYEGENMALIYEYMSNGTIEMHLSGKISSDISWKDKLRIAMDAAQGLEYLHNGCSPPIIHRDIKSSNILLDENFRAKLADFGLSRVFPNENDSHVTTQVAGTLGYLDPECIVTGVYTKKNDVYSFGVVMLEIVTGLAPQLKSQEFPHLIDWVNSVVVTGDITNIADPNFKGDFDTSCMWKYVEVAIACVSGNVMSRPSMTDVVMELKDCLEIEANRGQNNMSIAGLDTTGLLGPSAR